MNVITDQANCVTNMMTYRIDVVAQYVHYSEDGEIRSDLGRGRDRIGVTASKRVNAFRTRPEARNLPKSSAQIRNRWTDVGRGDFCRATKPSKPFPPSECPNK